jgi:hypothetical protein
VFFSPAHAFIGTTKTNFPAVDFINRNVIARSHGVLVNAPDVSKFGTIREIEFARSQNLPVAVTGDLGPSLMAYDLMVSDSLEGALLDLVAKIAVIQNTPPMMFGLPGMHIHLVQQEEEEQDAD